MIDFDRILKLSKSQLLKTEPVLCDLFRCDKIYDPESMQLYKHDLIEIGIVIQGNGIHQIADTMIPCAQGDIAVIRDGVEHGYFLAGEGESLVVRRLFFDINDWFDNDVCDPESLHFCYGIFCDNGQTAYATLNLFTQGEVFSFFDAIQSELRSKRNDWQNCIRSYLSLLLITVGRYINGAIKNLSAFPPSTVSFALQHISSNYGDSDLTLESISDSLYISKSHLSRLFKKITQRHFSEYLKSVRLSHAAQLLTQTTLTVEEIVEKCGLRDVPSFYRSFHEAFNTTPINYRNSNKTDSKEDKIMVILSEISENLQIGKAKVVKEMVQQAIDEGCDLQTILDEGLLAGMSIIGEKFKNNEVYVPEVLVAARALNMGLAVLKPCLLANGVVASGRVCIGTVQGDLHDIGKNLVRMMLEGKGLEVIDLGVDVAPETFIKTAIEQNCQVICCSALLTTTMGVMEDVVKAAVDAGVRDKVKIMIGGAPVNESFREAIGADCYTVDASSAADAAVELCKSLQ